MLNDFAAPMRMGLSAFEIDDSAEPVDSDGESAILVIHEGRLLAWEMGGDHAQVIDYVPVCRSRRVAVDG